MRMRDALIWCEKVNRLCERKAPKGWGGTSCPRPQIPQQQTKQDNEANTNELPLLKTTSFKGAKLYNIAEEGRAYLIDNIKKNRMVCFALDTTEIDIDELLFDHIDSKLKHERDKRFKSAKFIVQTIRSPQEIWHDSKNGRRALIGQYKIEGSSNILTMVVAITRIQKKKDKKDCNRKKKVYYAISAYHIVGNTAEKNKNWVNMQRKGNLEFRDGKKVTKL